MNLLVLLWKVVLSPSVGRWSGYYGGASSAVESAGWRKWGFSSEVGDKYGCGLWRYRL